MVTEATWPHSGLKRGLDVVSALLLMVLLFPVYVVLSVAVRVSLGAPVLFRQQRPGKDGQLFTLVKFRTLSGTEEERETPEGKRPPTRVARWLRVSGLDELPELWNILKGEMSFVGPRPLLVRYLDRYSPAQARRHHVRPGLTGWAQVHGRNDVEWNTRLEKDVWYVDHATPGVDLRILFRTVFHIGKASGVREPGEFQGGPSHD